MKTTLKREDKKFKVSFLDKNRIKADVELNLTYRNGYKEFTMSAHYNGSMGQCQSDIIPANEYQAALLALDKYHLNGMNAGTPEQEAIVSKLKDRSYDAAVKALKKKRKYTVKHPKTGKPYQYGSGWIHIDLPKNIESLITTAIDGINASEAKRKSKKSQLLKEAINVCTDDKETSLKSMDDSCLVDFIQEKLSTNEDEAQRIAALVKMFDLSEDDLSDVTIDGTRATVQGTDYLMGTDEEMEQEWKEELNRYIDDCVLSELKNESLQRYFDREAFIRDCKHEERGYSLNRYNGGEEEATINGISYYAYQQ